MIKRRIAFGGGGPKDGLSIDAEFPDQLAVEDMLAGGTMHFVSDDNPGMSHYYTVTEVQAVETTEADPVPDGPKICWVYMYYGEQPSPNDSQGA